MIDGYYHAIDRRLAGCQLGEEYAAVAGTKLEGAICLGCGCNRDN